MRLSFWNTTITSIWAFAGLTYMVADIQWPVTFALFYSLLALIVYPFGD